MSSAVSAAPKAPRLGTLAGPWPGSSTTNASTSPLVWTVVPLAVAVIPAAASVGLATIAAATAAATLAELIPEVVTTTSETPESVNWIVPQAATPQKGWVVGGVDASGATGASTTLLR